MNNNVLYPNPLNCTGISESVMQEGVNCRITLVFDDGNSRIIKDATSLTCFLGLPIMFPCGALWVGQVNRLATSSAATDFSGVSVNVAGNARI